MNKILEKIVSFNVKQTQSFDRRFPRLVRNGCYRSEIVSLIDSFISQKEFSHVLEVGGIERPLLKRSERIEYDGLDIEYKDMYKEFYDHFLVQSIEEPILRTYDLIVSIAVLEHISDNTLSITQMYKALRTGGCIVHYTPSKYHPYSLILRLVGPRIQKRLIRVLRPWAEHMTGYPAFFNKCSPREMKKISRASGFKQIKVIPFFRANDYFRFSAPAYILVTLWENICLKLKWEQLCSGFIIIARK
ncbi:MAG: class I SAM-dependent methyltransferase [Planctomycetota bacterium]|jgi:SAM-dependent methyltransferase